MIDNNKIFKEIAIKHGLTVDDVRRCVNSQFELLKSVIDEGKDESISLKYIGKFWVRPRRRELIKIRREKLSERIREKVREKKLRAGLQG